MHRPLANYKQPVQAWQQTTARPNPRLELSTGWPATCALVVVVEVVTLSLVVVRWWWTLYGSLEEDTVRC